MKTIEQYIDAEMNGKITRKKNKVEIKIVAHKTINT